MGQRIEVDAFQDNIRAQRRANGDDIPDPEHDSRHSHMIMMRLLGPLINFVNRPWKVKLSMVCWLLAELCKYRCIPSVFCLDLVCGKGLSDVAC